MKKMVENPTNKLYVEQFVKNMGRERLSSIRISTARGKITQILRDYIKDKDVKKLTKEDSEELRNTKEAYHYFEYLNYWEIVVTFCVKNRDEIHRIFSDLQTKYGDIIKDHEILWLIKKHKIDPYPDVEKIYFSN